jgi:tetratricopeptide (TPR) repeat protein
LSLELEEIERRLALGPDREELSGLRQRIISLFKDVEQLQLTVADLKEKIRPLVIRYKDLSRSTERPSRRDQLAASTYVEKGWHLIAQGQPDDAIRLLAQATGLAPEHLEARSLLGWAQARAGREEEAMATFTAVLERDPDNALARMNVGYLCLRKRAFGEAIEQLSRAIRIGTDRKATLYAHYYLGLVYLERGMLEDARTFLSRAIALGPNLLEAYCDLGRVEWQSGRIAAARAAWQQGARAGPGTPEGERCRELLERAERGESLASRLSR